MARILQDGFETEGKIYSTNRETGNTNINLDVAKFYTSVTTSSNYNYHRYGYCNSRGGYGKKSYGFYQEWTGNYNNYAHCCLKYDFTTNCNDTSELYYRVWVKPYNIGKMYAMAISNIELEKSNYTHNGVLNNTNCSVVCEKIDENTYKLNCYCIGSLVYSYNYLYYNQWVKIDVRLKVGDVNNGIFQLRINDKLITTFNGNTGTANPKYMFIGMPSSTETVAHRCEVDDIAINDTTGNVNNSWCGNGSIVGIVPTANGSKTMFTPGIEGTQNFENVDELLPDGDVTYNSSYVLNDIDLYKFTIPEELEIPPTETINAISVTTSAKFVEQPTDIGHIVFDGATETLIKQHELSNDYAPQASIIQEKADGTKYKVSDIDNLEFGYKTLESTKAQEE